MNKSNVLKYVIPIIAVLVIAESVYLVNSLISSKDSVNKVVDIVGQDYMAEETSQEKVMLSVVSDAEDYSIGSELTVNVLMVSKEELLADAINLYVSYDPTMAEVSDLVAGEGMPKPTFEKISDKKNMVVMNYYIEDNGLAFEPGEGRILATFKAKILKEGELNFDLSTGIEDKDSATMIVENSTSEAVPFSVSNLRVEIVK